MCVFHYGTINESTKAKLTTEWQHGYYIHGLKSLEFEILHISYTTIFNIIWLQAKDRIQWSEKSNE